MMECHHSVVEQHDAFTWFTQSQLQSVIKNGIVPEWFHGIISRKAAEELLMCKPPGYFLIRVSESRIGYTLSYRVADRCRHFMIDPLDDGQYIIVGENRRHQCLQDLVDYHRRNPIMPFTEVLTVSCGQVLGGKTDYAELLFFQRHQNPNTSSLQNNCLQPYQSPPVSQDCMPPALPYRPNNLLNSTVLPSSSNQPNRLYPRLQHEPQHVAYTVPTTSEPMTRKRYAADNSPGNKPPEVPAGRFAPLKPDKACVRTVPAPKSPSPPTVNENPSGANIHPEKIQDTKPSVISNLKNLKKKFQKNRSSSLENMYTEINVETTDGGGVTENEYQEITTEHKLPLSYGSTGVTLTEGVVPQEYLPPPPFAPGY